MRATRPVDGRGREILATPPELAAEIIEYQTLIAELPAGARVLEPSAGDGALVRAVLARNPTLQVTAIEPNPTRTQVLHGDPRITVIHTTIEEFSQSLLPRFDAVVMNPPFALEGQPTTWISHVLTAWNLLAPGGRLVAIVPNDFTFRRDDHHNSLRELITLHGGYRELPDNAYTGSGIGVRAVVILAYRPYLGGHRNTAQRGNEIANALARGEAECPI